MTVIKKDNGGTQFTSNSVFNIKYHGGPLASEEFGYEDIGQMTLGSEDAQRLRKKILEANAESKGKKIYPQVLVPHHAIRIFRHVKKYNPETGYLLGGGNPSQSAGKTITDFITGAASAISTAGGFVTNVLTEGSNALSDLVNGSPQEELGISYFEVVPQDGYHDFLGITFGYSYDETVTEFKLTINNERGKNKNTFMSGDVIEFFFDLVDDATLAAAEKNSMFVEHDHRSTAGLNMCFTGVLETVEYVNSPEGLTIMWSGRNGAHILTQREVNAVYPLQSLGFGASVGSMSYEQIAWELIVGNTGMVVGEVDLGNYPIFGQFYSQGQGAESLADKMTAGDDLNTMDLLGDPNALRSNTNAFRDGLKEVMKKYAFCVYEDSATKQRRIRWSSLLEFDILRPGVFSIAEISGVTGSGTESQPVGAGLESGSLGSYHYGTIDAEYQHLPPNLRFQTRLGRDIFRYQYDRAVKNFKTILDRAPIKVEEYRGLKTAVMAVQMSLATIRGGGGDMPGIKNMLFDQLVRQQYSSLPGATIEVVKKRFNDDLTATYKAYVGGASGQAITRFQDLKDQTGSGVADENRASGRSFDYNSFPIESKVQNPDDKLQQGHYLLVPLDPDAYVDDANKMRVKAINSTPILRSGDTPSLEPDPKKYEESLMTISTVYTMAQGAASGITLSIKKHSSVSEVGQGGAGGQGGARIDYVHLRVVYNSGEGGSANQGVILDKVVINNVSVIAQLLDQTGVFDVTLTSRVNGKSAYPGGLSQPVAVQEIAFESVTSKNVVRLKSPGDTYTNKNFEARGHVLECIQNILKKFFACVLYVDEYNIAHIRPRYKNLQKTGAKAPPIWGLYGGQPVYPRLFKSTLKDGLKAVPNTVIIFGQCNNDQDQIIARASHGMLQARFGEFHKMDDSNNVSTNNKFEAYNIAKNTLLDYIRGGYTASVECDIIPELRPGHRLDVVDPITNMVGRFIIENISWTYSKDTGMKMLVNMASMMLATDDSYTAAAIKLEGRLDDAYKARTQISSQGSGNKDRFFLGSLLRTISVEAGKAASAQELQESQERWRTQMDVYNETKDLTEFILEGDASVVTFKGRRGFDGEPVDPTKLEELDDATGGIVAPAVRQSDLAGIKRT